MWLSINGEISWMAEKKRSRLFQGASLFIKNLITIIIINSLVGLRSNYSTAAKFFSGAPASVSWSAFAAYLSKFA
jgi:hypothetical protein